jgi:hypothetical protein
VGVGCAFADETMKSTMDANAILNVIYSFYLLNSQEK